eukprot:4880759-Amphidinium_carterae.3
MRTAMCQGCGGARGGDRPHNGDCEAQHMLSSNEKCSIRKFNVRACTSILPSVDCQRATSRAPTIAQDFLGSWFPLWSRGAAIALRAQLALP